MVTLLRCSLERTPSVDHRSPIVFMICFISSLSFFVGCAHFERAQSQKERVTFEAMKSILNQGDELARQTLQDYLTNYRERSIGNPLAEVRESPYRKEAIKLFETAYHRVTLEARWHDAWITLWTQGELKGLAAFEAILSDYRDHSLGNVYEDELLRSVQELKSNRAPSKLSPQGVRWVGVSGDDRADTTQRGLCVAQSEVTVAQYKRCVQAERCDAPSQGGGCLWGEAGHDTQPINCLDWRQAQQYATWIDARLPTLSEWKYIAQSGRMRWDYPWGDDAPRCAHGALSGNERDCTQRGPRVICRFVEGLSAQGVCDLAGNVREWLACEGVACRSSERSHIGGSWKTTVYTLSLTETKVSSNKYRYYDLGMRPIQDCFPADP